MSKEKKEELEFNISNTNFGIRNPEIREAAKFGLSVAAGIFLIAGTGMVIQKGLELAFEDN